MDNPAESGQTTILPGGSPAGSDKTMAIVAHLLPLVGVLIPFGNLIGPFIFWLLKKDSDPALRPHLTEVLNFQISLTIYFVISAILMLILIGFLLMIGVGIFGLVCMVIAALKASNGEDFRYPLCIRLVS